MYKQLHFLFHATLLCTRALRNLVESVNDKMNNFETLFSLIRTMVDEQTLLKSENAELRC